MKRVNNRLIVSAAAWMLAALWAVSQAGGAQPPIVLFEDALNGATKGKQEGGEFVAGGGWRAVNPYDRLLIELPRAARDGSAFEIDIKNLDVPRQRDAGENFLFGLWEQLDGEAGGDQNRPGRDCFYLYAGTKYPQFKLKFHTHGFGWFEKTYEPIKSFDPNHTYRLRVEWQNRVVKVSIDGQTVVTWESPAHDPMDRFRLIQVAARHGEKSPQQGLRGPVYANVRVVRLAPTADDKGAPADLAVIDQTAAGAHLEWQAPDGLREVKHYRVYRDGKPIHTTSATNYTDGGLADGEYSYTVKAVSATGKESPASNAVKVSVVAPSIAAKRAATVKVDGKLDEGEWDVSRRAFKQLKGGAAESVKFGALWDDEYLYIGIKVADAKLMKDSAELTDDDAVEILIDGNNSGAPLTYGKRTFDPSDRQFVKRWADDGLFVKVGKEKGQYVADGKVDGVRHALAQVEGGYAVEMAVSWASLGLQLGDVQAIGFDVRAYDDDDGKEADAVTVWQSAHLNSLITSAYGDLLLKPAAPGGNKARQ